MSICPSEAFGIHCNGIDWHFPLDYLSYMTFELEIKQFSPMTPVIGRYPIKAFSLY